MLGACSVIFWHGSLFECSDVGIVNSAANLLGGKLHEFVVGEPVVAVSVLLDLTLLDGGLGQAGCVLRREQG